MKKRPENIKEDGSVTPSSKKYKNRGSHTSSLPSSMVLDDPIEESARKRTSINEDKSITPAMQQAYGVLNSLNLKFPNFVRSMLHSHVNRGFWLGLPSTFCTTYLPKEDVEITLVDENKGEYTTKYLSKKNGLSGGWRGFAIAHKLVEGDALIFHLVEATKFEVIIIRANSMGDIKPLTRLRKIDSRKHIKMFVEKSPKNIKEDESMTPSSKMFKNRGSPTSPRPSSMVVNDPIEESTRNRPSINKREAMSPAIERAYEIQKSLNLKFPYFVKSMRPTQVTRVFWLSVPVKFCTMYLPEEDIEFTLVDENKEEYATRYLSSKNGLSAGWKRFSDAHGLLEGDALIFHLVEATKFEVIIIRANSLSDVKPLTPRRKIDSRNHIKTDKRSEGRKPRTRKLTELRPRVEDVENRSGEDTSEVLEGTKLYQNAIKFEDIIRGQASFSVVVNGLNIDSELSEYTISKYYKLCSSQNAFLHDKLLKGMNRKLVAGIISETVDIADAIEACKLNLSSSEFASWDACLGAFEQMGMNVAFLRDQLQQMVGTTKESKKMATPKKHKKLQLKKANSESKNKGNSKKRGKLSDRDTLCSMICFESRGQEGTLERKTRGKAKTVASKICHEDMDELAHVDEDMRHLRSQIMERKSPSKRAAESVSRNKGKPKKRSRLSNHDTFDSKNCLDSRGQEEDTHEIEICGEPKTVETKIRHEDMDELAEVENDIRDLRSQIMELKNSSKKSKS